MAKHHPDLIFCRKQPGVGKLNRKTFILTCVCCVYVVKRIPIDVDLVKIMNCSFVAAIGRLCEKCDGKCVICDSYVRPCTLVRICDECNYGSYQGRCVICGGPGVSDAYYCKECTIQEKDVSLLAFNSIRTNNFLSTSQQTLNVIISCVFLCREMVVQRLSIWAVQKRICSTNGKSMVSSRGDTNQRAFSSELLSIFNFYINFTADCNPNNFNKQLMISIR